MKQQIKKLCKQLSRFNFDEITSILELSDDKVQKIIQDLIAEKVISKISDTEFTYVPDIVSYPQIEALPQKTSPKQSSCVLILQHYYLITKKHKNYLIMPQNIINAIL